MKHEWVLVEGGYAQCKRCGAVYPASNRCPVSPQTKEP